MPGLLLCFVLRYDNYKKQASGDSCGAPGPANISGRMQKVSYFHCTLIGYFVGERPAGQRPVLLLPRSVRPQEQELLPRTQGVLGGGGAGGGAGPRTSGSGAHTTTDRKQQRSLGQK